VAVAELANDAISGGAPAACRIPMVDLAAEYAEVGAAVEAAVLRVLRSRRYLLGPETAAFESELARRVGVREAVGVGSGTQALFLALRACGVGPGDEVITTPFSFFATAEAILLLGAVPVFADIEPDGFNLDPAAVEGVVTARTRAVVPVHVFGRCADMARLVALASERKLALVEDAAQAIGAVRAARPAGSWGHAAAFSFYPSKNLGAAGDAGCVTTDDRELAERLRSLRNHGQTAQGGHRTVGTTARMDELQAAVLRAKLPHLKAWTDRRARNAARYGRLLAGCPDLVVPAADPEETPVWSQLTLRSPRAESVRRALAAAGIESRRFYPRPIYREPGFQHSGLAPVSPCPRAERACEEAFSVPVHPALAPADLESVCDVIRATLEGP